MKVVKLSIEAVSAPSNMPEELTAVGRVSLDRRLPPCILAFDQSRNAYAVSPEGSEEAIPLEREDVLEHLKWAVEHAASKLWPDDWKIAMSESFWINRRSVQMGRIFTNGLPTGILSLLAESSSRPDAKVFGQMLRVLGKAATDDKDVDLVRIAEEASAFSNKLWTNKRLHSQRLAEEGLV